MTVIRQFNEDDQHVIAKKGDKLILTTIVPEAYIIDHCLSLANATNDWGHSIILIKLKIFLQQTSVYKSYEIKLD